MTDLLDRPAGNPLVHCLPDLTVDVDTGVEQIIDVAGDQVIQCVLDALPDIVGNAHASSIVAVVIAGIASGFTDGTFDPQQPVTRGQMATFLTRALDL